MASDHTLRVYDSILGLLADVENPTPLVRLNRIPTFRHAAIYAKLEWYNPFGAVKDRIAANMIRDAEERGALVQGHKLVEATSGNTGLGLAMMGNAKGYALRTPLSVAIPLEKRMVLRFLGSDVIELSDTLCPAPGAPEGAIATARDTARSDPGFVLLDQYANPANPDSHYRTTGPEIWRQTQGRVTHFVAGLGTCGTITGTGRFLKEQRRDIRVIGVYPEDGHDIPGVRSMAQLPQTQFYRPQEYDAQIEIEDKESYGLCLRLNREESIIAGPSSGMALAGALRQVPDEPGTLAVVIFPDNIFKYASSVQRHFPDLNPPDLNPPDLRPSDSSSASTETSTTSKDGALLAEMIENLKNPYDSIKVEDLVAAMEHSATRPLVIDVRPPGMYAGAHIPGSINLPQEELRQRKAELPADRDASIVMVCGIGKFSKPTTLYLKSMGYRNVRNLKGGIGEWARKGRPMDPAGGSVPATS